MENPDRDKVGTLVLIFLSIMLGYFIVYGVLALFIA